MFCFVFLLWLALSNLSFEWCADCSQLRTEIGWGKKGSQRQVCVWEQNERKTSDELTELQCNHISNINIPLGTLNSLATCNWMRDSIEILYVCILAYNTWMPKDCLCSWVNSIWSKMDYFRMNIIAFEIKLNHIPSTPITRRNQ